jgi:hypothetical protein
VRCATEGGGERSRDGGATASRESVCTRRCRGQRVNERQQRETVGRERERGVRWLLLLIMMTDGELIDGVADSHKDKDKDKGLGLGGFVVCMRPVTLYGLGRPFHPTDRRGLLRFALIPFGSPYKPLTTTTTIFFYSTYLQPMMSDYS